MNVHDVYTMTVCVCVFGEHECVNYGLKCYLVLLTLDGFDETFDVTVIVYVTYNLAVLHYAPYIYLGAT